MLHKVKTYMSWLLISGVLSSCTSSPPIRKLPPEEISCRDRVMWGEISKNFEMHLKLKKNHEVVDYLERLADVLGRSTSGLRGEKIHVSLIQEQNGKWESFSLPGHYLYLPIDLIKELEFENEVAALIAIQLGHLANRDVLYNLKSTVFPFENEKLDEDLLADSLSTAERTAMEEKLKSKRMEISSLAEILELRNVGQLLELGYFKPKGVISFSKQEELAAVQTAVGILYRAGFDARGIVSLFHYFEKKSRFSPYSNEMMSQLIESARREIALYAPVRNPVIRSQSFLMMHKKFRRL